MSRELRKLAAFCTILLALSASSALAQERLFVYDYLRNLLAEVDTHESSFGLVRRVVSLPPFISDAPVPLAGGRFLMLRGVPPALLDTRTLAVIAMPQWAALQGLGSITVDSDALRPRIFYRTLNEFGVIEGPSFIPRVLGVTGDLNTCCGIGFLKFVAESNMLLLTRRLSTADAQVVRFDADTGVFKGSITLGGRAGALLVDRLSNRLYVPVGVGSFGGESTLRAYDLTTFALVSETAAYPLTEGDFLFSGGAHWTIDHTYNRIVRADPGLDRASTAWAVALDADLKPVAHIDFDRRFGAARLMPSTVRDRTFAFLMTPGYGGSSGGAPQRGTAIVMALNSSTLEPLASVDLLANSSATFDAFGFSTAMILSPPPPPSSLTHTISGRRVELTWRDPGDATHFVVQVGSEPGRSNLATIHVGNALQFASDAPPGRYYVRVQALNDVGLSLPSNEVVVVVP